MGSLANDAQSLEQVIHKGNIAILIISISYVLISAVIILFASKIVVNLLKRLIKQKSSDYRVWWEASKPIDFWEDTFSEEMIVKYKIDDTYFAKALDYADIEVKKKMIDERDSYQERKRNALDKIQAEKKIEEDRIAAEKRVADKKKEEERENK